MGFVNERMGGLESLKTAPQAWKTIFRAARLNP
jgi:hypothetical protein